MEKSYSNSYKEAGVDVTAGYESVELIKADVKRTSIPGVLGGIGGFGGLFAPDLTGYEKPVLISGTDGVGTKLKLAFLWTIIESNPLASVTLNFNFFFQTLPWSRYQPALAL